MLHLCSRSRQTKPMVLMMLSYLECASRSNSFARDSFQVSGSRCGKGVASSSRRVGKLVVRFVGVQSRKGFNEDRWVSFWRARRSIGCSIEEDGIKENWRIKLQREISMSICASAI